MKECHILHVDMDAFFAAIEVRDNPEYEGHPLIICGSSTKRGIVSTCSYAARKYGVHSAMPVIKARRLCPQGIYLAGDHKKYEKEGQIIHEIFRRYTPVCEPISIDEAFLDVRGTMHLFGNGTEIAQKIRKDIRSERGLVASVGVSYNKFLAKLASDYRKPDGLVTIPRKQAESFLSDLPVSCMWGVGEQAQEKLKSRGITEIGDLRKMGVERLTELFGKSGRKLYDLAWGRDSREVEPSSARKSVSRERTYFELLKGKDSIRAEILELLDEVTYRLRKKGYYGSTLTLKIRFADFKTITRTRSLPAPSRLSADYVPFAGELIAEAGIEERAVRLLGVGISGLSRSGIQLALDPGDTRLTNVLDDIKDRYGEAGIRRASSLLSGPGDSKV